jgi:hypothetical protein
MAITLADLPVEIFHHIIDELPRYKFSNTDTAIPRLWHFKELRLVSRSIERKTRARFAHEFFASLVIPVPLQLHKRTQHILADAIFRDSIRTINVNIYFPRKPFAQDCGNGLGHDKEYEKTLEDFLVKCSITSNFGQLLKTLHHVTGLTISTGRAPKVYCSQAKCRGNNMVLRRTIARETLRTVLMVETIRLENIQLGDEFENGTGIPPSLLRDLPETSTSLSELTSLRLVGFVDGVHDVESTLPFEPWDEPQDLFNFLTPARRLTNLEYSGLQNGPYMAQNLGRGYRVLETLTLTPTVTNLTLSHFVIAENLPCFGDSLKVLRLESIGLIDIEWRQVFQVLRESLNLDIFEAKNLEEDNDVMVDFQLINRDRPITESLKIITQCWDERWWERPTIADDDWLWVSHDPYNWKISLSAKGGDDMDAWLSRVEQQYQLEALFM